MGNVAPLPLGPDGRVAIDEITRVGKLFIEKCTGKGEDKFQVKAGNEGNFDAQVKQFVADFEKLQSLCRAVHAMPTFVNSEKLKTEYDAIQTKMDNVIALVELPAVKASPSDTSAEPSSSDTAPGAAVIPGPGAVAPAGPSVAVKPGTPDPHKPADPSVAVKPGTPDPHKPTAPADDTADANLTVPKNAADTKQDDKPKDGTLGTDTEVDKPPERDHVKAETDAGDIRAAFAAAFSLLFKIIAREAEYRSNLGNYNNEQKRKSDDLAGQQKGIGVGSSSDGPTPASALAPGDTDLKVTEGVAPAPPAPDSDATKVTTSSSAAPTPMLAGVALALEGQQKPTDVPPGPPALPILPLQAEAMEGSTQVMLQLAKEVAAEKTVELPGPSHSEGPGPGH